MNVVGFDVGKDSLYGARIDRSGTVKERFELANNKAAIEPVLMRLRTKYAHLVVASEATGEYHRVLALTCLSLGIAFYLLNPITTKQFIRASVRKRKTDVTDAEHIARAAMQGAGTPVTGETFAVAKPILRTSLKLSQLARTLSRMQQHLATVAPEDSELQKEVAQCRKQLELAARVFRWHAGQCSPRELRTLLRGIPGIGELVSLILLTEIGDIGRFKTPESLIAYAGLDPKVRQSGLTLNRNGKLTKRGSPHLRWALYCAASVAVRCDAELQGVYAKKRAEGKRYTEATIVVARKLLNRVYAVWKRGTPYEVREKA